MKRTLVVVATVLVTASLAWSSGGPDPLQSAIRDSLSQEESTRNAGVEALRDHGQEGLDALMEAQLAGRFSVSDAQWTLAIDSVAAQKDAEWSGLFWHTDLDAAMDEAHETGKPILSLRMLGDLRDRYSCANSRFFRSVLYTHPDLQDQLQEDFVLHWSSERAVPKITIDFGDGRVLESTITGNSAHYVLDADGRPLDVIPGLWAPGAFSVALDSAHGLHAAVVANPKRAAQKISAHHQAARDQALQRVQVDGEFGRDLSVAVLGKQAAVAPVPAVRAIPIAMGKGISEGPLARAFLPADANPRTITRTDLTPLAWEPLHASARDHIASLHPELDADSPALNTLMARFESEVALDTAFNQDVLHARIHDWFVSQPTVDFKSLNRRVYNELFETPAGDPWLGLYDPAVFSGLPSGGLQ